MKAHLGIDAKTHEIVSEIVTESAVGDSKMTEPSLKQIFGRAKGVMTDGGYDKGEARKAIRKRKAKEIIPSLRNARYKGKMMNEIRPY
ncbi:MAG: transposase [Parachlamydiaceae bacterium]